VSTQKGIDRNRQHDITIDEVKACSMFAHLSDEEAQEVVDTVKRFVLIVYNFYQKEQRKTMKKVG